MRDFPTLHHVDGRKTLSRESTLINCHPRLARIYTDIPIFYFAVFYPLTLFSVPGEMNWSGCRASFKTSGSEMFDGPRASGSLCWGLVCVLGHATKLPSSTSPECVGNSGHGCTFPLETTSWTITATQSVLSARPCTWLCAVKTPLQTSLLRLSMSSTSSPKPAKKYALKWVYFSDKIISIVAEKESSLH